MSDIDPVEFGEMKSNVTHTMKAVGNIEVMMASHIQIAQDARKEADRANSRIDTKDTVEKKFNKKMAGFLALIGACAGVIGGFIKALLT